MKIFLKIDLKRLLKSWSFWIVLAIAMFLSLAQFFKCPCNLIQYMYVSDKELTRTLEKMQNMVFMPHGVFVNWIGGEIYSFWHYTYFMLLPLLCVLPFGTSICSDKKLGLQKNYFIRHKKSDYYKSKYLVTFVSGGMVVTLPLAINLFLTAAILPSFIPQCSSGLCPIFGASVFSSIYYTHPYIYCLIFLVLIFVFSGLMACMTLSLGIIISNSFTILLTPFIIYMFLYAVLQENQVKKFVPYGFLDPTQGNVYNSLTVIIIEIIILIAFSIGFAFLGKNSETL